MAQLSVKLQACSYHLHLNNRVFVCVCLNLWCTSTCAYFGHCLIGMNEARHHQVGMQQATYCCAVYARVLRYLRERPSATLFAAQQLES